MTEGRVVGIGGVFLRSDDPARLAAWYRDHLGVIMTEAGKPDPDGNWNWTQEAGDTSMTVFARASDYWPEQRPLMLNFRVEGLEDLLQRLERADVTVSRRQVMDGIGSFARVADCDGNPVELWEPS